MMFGYLLYKMTKEKLVEEDGSLMLGLAAFFELLVEIVFVPIILSRI